MIGLGSGLTSHAEFNRRALIALRGVRFGSLNNAPRLIDEYKQQVAAGEVTDKVQQAAFNIIHRYRAQVTDAQVSAYAADRAQGAD